MSRYCGEHDSGPILEAAAHWRDSCLIGGQSVFSSKAIWSDACLGELDQFFVQRLDVEGTGFLNKLETQLAPTSPTAKQLAAEMIWLIYLCPSSMTSTHKLQTVTTVWKWSGEELPKDTPLLSQSVLSGIGSAGPGFNQNQWRELVFVIATVTKFRSLDTAAQRQIVQDAWEFDDWLSTVPGSATRQFRHMLLFLLFPDSFERIFGQTDRKAVVVRFSTDKGAQVSNMTPTDLDRELYKIRSKLEAQHETPSLDFYLPPLVSKWKSIVDEAVLDSDGQAVAASDVTQLTSEQREAALGTLVSKFLDQSRQGSMLGVQDYLRKYSGLEVRVSFGKGNIARIPWIAFLASGQSVSRGIYPVLLLFREQQKLLLCYGVSEEGEADTAWTNIQNATTVREWFKQEYGHTPKRYGASFVRRAFEIGRPIDTALLRSELDCVIDEYKASLGEHLQVRLAAPEVTVSQSDLLTRVDMRATVQDFSNALRESGVRFGANHDDLVGSFVASLATKPLVILTGLSGSGKTQIAIRFGEWLGRDRLYVAAVRPDWTGAEFLFGYEDALRPARDGRAAWSVPGPLRFILRAAADAQHPYLLVLDEMNLAHVERYFADVLSGMESGQPCLPNLIEGDDACWRLGSKTERICWPPNLWIVGTVNVDETTYLFSPKVLDRANTFEFRVETSDLALAETRPVSSREGPQDLVRGLLQISIHGGKDLEVNSSLQSEIGEQLRSLHAVLCRYGLEFGHRVYCEALKFSTLAQAAGQTSLAPILDRIVMQKILPRLHGSRRRLELPLLALAQFCRDLPNTIDPDEKLHSSELDLPGSAPPKLPIAYHKLKRMLGALRVNQFASFTE